jgi:hypothetical protein
MPAVKAGLTVLTGLPNKKTTGDEPGGFKSRKKTAPPQGGAVFLYYEPLVMLPPMPTNLFLITLPSVGIVATRAKAIAEAMRAYSIAVAPDSSFMKRTNLFILILQVILKHLVPLSDASCTDSVNHGPTLAATN